MPLDDLNMMANPPVTPADADAVSDANPPVASDEDAQADIGKAAAGETMPPPKEPCEECEDTRAGRIARRGQDPPEPEN
jgi:hypothetical protein